jgi:hypothetical protein
MCKPVIVVLPLVLLSGVFADGSAHAQCAPEDKIYIDPRLVPKRPVLTPRGFSAVMAARRRDPLDDYLLQQTMQRNQPIVIPYGTGKVLVHPTNPCIQQYIP